MHILCVTSYYKPAYIYGGPARSVPLLCEGMAKAGAQVTVYTTNANGPGHFLDVPTDHPVEVGGVQVHFFPVSWPLGRYYPFYSPVLGRACDKLKKQFDAVYVIGDWTYPGFKGAQASIREKIPYVMSPRGSLMDWSMGEKALKKNIYLSLIERRLINSAMAIHVTSSLEEQQLHQWRFKPPITKIPNGIDLSSFTVLPQRGKLRCSLNIPQAGTLSLFVGRLHKEKRLDLIINTFAAIAHQSYEPHFVIVGRDQDGSGKAAQEQVRRLGLTDRVHFMGMLTGADLVQAYIDADLLVLLSFRENFGMVVLEAMAAGLPVLLAKEVGLAAEVEHAKAGLVVNARPDEIAAAWQDVISDQQLREKMGKQGKRLVQEQFASEIVSARMLDLFASISSKR